MHRTLIDAIGNTPLVKIPFGIDATICAKLEYLNPGGSVKDRSAKFMIEHAEKTGKLRPGGTLIDASSGNQGIRKSKYRKTSINQSIWCTSGNVPINRLYR